jgi:hypothetical protein
LKILIHQSICGEVNKAWGLIRTTLTDANIARSVAFKTDLQDQTSGVNWEPAIRGFSEADFYLIMKTFEDTSHDVRSGRKFSYVLMILKKDIVETANIEQILNLLPDEINKNSVLEPIELEISSMNTDNYKTIQGRFNKLINGYINIKSYKNKLVWIGQENFDIAVIELWKRLTVPERANFQFGIAFNNENKITEDITLITVPVSVQSKFVKSDFFVINLNDNYEPTELIEHLLIGNTSVKKRITYFEKTIEAESLSRADIPLIAKGLDSFEQLDAIKDLKKLNTLSHIIAKYAPSDKQGVGYKKLLLKKISDLAVSANFPELNVLRNFKTESFKNSKELLSATLIDWIIQYIFSVENNTIGNISFFEMIKINNLNWWDKVIRKEMEKYLSFFEPSKVDVVYSWLEKSPSVFTNFKFLIDRSKKTEKYFIEKLPGKISQELIKELAEFSITNYWFILYAHLLNRQFKMEIALAELFKFDVDINNFESLEVILLGKSEKSIIDFAIDTGESRMIKKAGKICHNSPRNLSRINILNRNWQLIWTEAIINGNQIETGLKDPEKIIHLLFDHLLEGHPVDQILIDKISQSEFGNILSYHNRINLWGKLPPGTEFNFLVKTSSVLLKKLSENSNTIIPDDMILANHISQRGLSDFLYYNRNNIKTVIPIFEKFNQLYDNNLGDYLNNYSGQINAVEATQLGNLIATKSFVNCAYIIHNKSTKYNNWRFALEKCHYLLDMFTKGILRFSGVLNSVSIPTDQWWQSTEDLIVELYSNGTSLTTIWKKAGGKESDLLTKGTANDIWNDVLYKVRKNQLKNITMNKLLKEIEKQYGDNQKFRIIYDLRSNYIKT